MSRVHRVEYPPAIPPRLRLESFARQAGVHPELVRRFVALGLVEAVRDDAGQLWLPLGELSKVARIQRLRAGLALNYASIGLVIDLLDRIDELEAALRAGSLPARPPARSAGGGRRGQAPGTRYGPTGRRDPGWT
jgi:chaperone modulatory protein CbpM